MFSVSRRRSRLEDTITFHLIERVQFPLNKAIYQPGGVQIGQDDESLSFVDWYLREQEKLQSLIRRYESPDEYPFFPDALQKPLLKPVKYPKILHPNDVNVNDKLKEAYVESVLQSICPTRERE